MLSASVLVAATQRRLHDRYKTRSQFKRINAQRIIGRLYFWAYFAQTYSRLLVQNAMLVWCGPLGKAISQSWIFSENCLTLKPLLCLQMLPKWECWWSWPWEEIQSQLTPSRTALGIYCKSSFVFKKLVSSRMNNTSKHKCNFPKSVRLNKNFNSIFPNWSQ